MSKQNRLEADACLDEIDAALDLAESGKGDRAKSDGWIRKQKIRLKELGYTGKIRRAKRGKKPEKQEY